jgi:long-chain fatty acid transport protein
MKSLTRWRVALGFGFLSSLPLPAGADGFGVYTNGARAAGMGGAWAARVMDPSAIFYNVAGMSQLEGTQIYGGAFVIVNFGNGVELFDGRDFDQEDKTFLVPHLYLTHALSDKLAAGIGLFTPFGLGIEWKREGFPGRFRAYDTDLKSLYVQPSASYTLSRTISIGAGLDLVFSEIELNREADLSTLVLTPAGATFGQVTGLEPNTVGFLDTELRASGNGLGFNVGLLLKAGPAVQFGLNYRSEVTIDFEGGAVFTQLPTGIVLQAGNPLGAPAGTPLDAVLQSRLPGNQEATAEVTFPDQIIGGVSVTPSERWMVNADLKWTNWKDFEAVILDFAEDNPGEEVLDFDYENGTSFRVGTEYFATPDVALRAGFIRDENPAPEKSVTPLLPDADRNEVSVGLGYAIGPVQIDGYLLVEFFEDRDGVVGANDDIPDGSYDTRGTLLGVDLGYRF